MPWTRRTSGRTGSSFSGCSDPIRGRLLLAELAWQRNDREAATRELETSRWLVEQLGPIDAQRRAHALSEKLRSQA